MAEEKSQKTEIGSQKSEEKKSEASMVAPHPLGKGKKKTEEGLKPVEDLAEEAKLKPWETAGLLRAAGWAEGKQVTKNEFDSVLSAFRCRPQGGGRIQTN